ncbi:dethiobiotin synthetase [Herbihabitans rhizosphaerae]|uniref:ATP-dependent dethiobiotin synthetase BioD n=1 Tax=Herbihabitans rhizosphaerae TaxID=1872711 RepID=A0A4Q7KIU2_9PSEU|nr:dethiobiotin synthase [Herbihabitans rhizosphaerae]RZS34858.1 dethiobiotin synthetase [Herbihabitans rhizosphaerae]
MAVIVITGTNTGVGKTIVTAALAALTRAGGRRVAVLKPAQTGVAPGEEGDLDVVRRLADGVTTRELRRYPEPLAPDTAARRAGLPPVRPADVAAAAGELSSDHDLVLIEGAGGLLVRFDDAGGTLADVAWSLGAPVLVVAQAGLGTLNATALTTESLRHRGISCAGVVVGSWPREPDLASRCNLADLPTVAGAPLAGALPEDAGKLDAAEFLDAARRGLAPGFGGTFDPAEFSRSAGA